MPPPPALTKARLAELKGLRDKRRRQAAGRFLVEGFHVVEEALEAAAPVEEILLGEGASRSPAGQRVAETARAARIRVTEVPRRVIEALADAESPQPILAVVRLPAPDAPLPVDRDGVLVILDGVQDPGNAGAILRAADAFGCAAAIFARGTVEPLNAKVLRAGQGAHFHLPVVPGPAAAEAVRAARAAGHRAIAAVTRGGEPLWGIASPARRVAVVLGNEARGPAEETLAACDGRVTIPLRGRAESLGVAAAAAVVLGWLARPGSPA
jgi:TrmH family RNA methyltransferase